jgi:hypothetical protein
MTDLHQRFERAENWGMFAVLFIAVGLALWAGLSMVAPLSDVFSFQPEWKIEYVAEVTAGIPEDYTDRVPGAGEYEAMQDQTAKDLLAAAGCRDPDFKKWGYILVHGPMIDEAQTSSNQLRTPVAAWSAVEKCATWFLYRYPRSFYKQMAHDVPFKLAPGDLSEKNRG